MTRVELLNVCTISLSTLLLILLLFVTMAHAQRPFFAGGRPAGGLNQKDKYNHPELAAGILPATTTSDPKDIVNRFGSSNNNNNNNINNINNKQGNIPQKPPVGLPVVYPESQYQPLPQQNNQFTTTITSLNGAIANRFGGSASDNEVLLSTSSTNRPESLPLDARGDEELVNQLSRLPPEKQPFWFLNYQAIEAQRQVTAVNGGPVTTARSHFLG